MMELGEVKYTENWLEYIEFKDTFGLPCLLEQSSLGERDDPGTSAIWLGLGGHLMHLNRRQVRALIGVLVRWLDTGSFKESTCTMPIGSPLKTKAGIMQELDVALGRIADGLRSMWLLHSQAEREAVYQEIDATQELLRRLRSQLLELDRKLPKGDAA